MMSTSNERRGYLPKRMHRKPFRSVLSRPPIRSDRSGLGWTPLPPSRAVSGALVLSMDIEYMACMPNLKISNRNTIQATGCQDMEVLSGILHFLVTKYKDRGFQYDPTNKLVRAVQDVCLELSIRPGFVGDVVLANVHFKLGWRIDRLQSEQTEKIFFVLGLSTRRNEY